MLSILVFTILALYALSYVLPIGVAGSRLHGSAHFIRNSLLHRSHAGLVIDGKRRLTPENSFVHSLVVSSTGAGKTTRYVLPNVLSLDDCSMVITDPKGEVYDLAAHLLHQKGFKVLVLDFQSPDKSLRYNPLLRVVSESELKQLAMSLFDMSNAGTKTEGIWRLGAVRILEVLLRCLRNLPDQRHATLANLIYLLNHVENGTTKIEAFVNRYAPDDETKERLKSFSSQEIKIKLGQLASALACLSPFDTQEIKSLTATDTIDFTSFRKQKTALFLKLPVGRSSQYSPVLSLFYSQFLHHLLNEPVADGDLPIYFILEEFQNLRRIPEFESIVALIRSKRVSLSLVVQNISQLDQVYGKDTTETILANTASLIVYPGVREKRTLDLVQQLLGTTTKEVFTPGAYGMQITSRPLMTADEIRTMPAHRGLFIFGNMYGQKIRPLPLFKNKALMETCNITSTDGKLIALGHYEPPSALPSGEPQRFSLDEEIVDAETKEMKERLNEILV